MATAIYSSPDDSLRHEVQSWLYEMKASIPQLGVKSKHIRDPLHGSVVLSPEEVRLLDTNVMQRLRGIHQLGLAYLIYPSSGHSRFEHSLGVRFVAEKMIDRLEIVRGPYKHEERVTVLAAALLHDIGHTLFSHAIEMIIYSTPRLRRQYDPEDGALHEQIGAILVTEDPLTTCLVEMGADPRIVAALMCHDVKTLTALQFPPELWGVISGPIDADKLDYFARDSYFSGIISAIDPERIFQTLTIGPDNQLAITLAGASALDQMLYDRVRMYSDLYGHQKILAAESSVRALIEAMTKRGTHGKRHIYVRGTDGMLIPLGMDRLTDYLRLSDEAFLATPTDSPIIATIQNRLLRRELLRAAYTLTFEMVQNASEDPNLEISYLQSLPGLRTSESLLKLRHTIHEYHPEIPMQDIWAASVRCPSMDGMATIVVGRDGQPARMGTMFEDWDTLDDNALPAHTIRRHFELYRARISIFCPPENVSQVRKTARKVLQEAWGDGNLYE
jgi:HD superfamily phosphohydrolase